MRRILKRALIGIVTFIAVVAIFLEVQIQFGNFHEVIPGELYRSAQVEAGDLTRYHQEHKIASVLNLRGNNTGTPWYDDEVREAKQLNIKHIDFSMKASRELTKEQALALIDIMRNAPKPLLIHCHAGADRTGLASALYVAAIANQGEWAAEKQMWMTYGHLPFWINSSYAMNRTFERLEPYLGYQGT